ncbi:hypothetical protein ACHAXS_009209 [Conticribra weissflogii]
MMAYVVEPHAKTGKVTEVPVPSIPSPNHALIRGYMGFSGILGHEFVGIVDSLHDDAPPSLRSRWLRRRVCGDINFGCRNCGICDDSKGYDAHCPRMGRNHCPQRTVLGILNQNGTFAEYAILPLENLHAVPEGMADEVAVFAEPLAAACRIAEQGLMRFRYEAGSKRREARGGDEVAILGDGKLGLCVAEILGREYLKCRGNGNGAESEDGAGDAMMPPPPVLFGRHRRKLDLVSDSGVRTMLVSECYLDEEQTQLSRSHIHKYDVVIDATGNPDGLTLAMSLCRPMGTLVLKSTCAAGVKGFHSAPIVIDELTVVGSRCGPIDKALELLSIDATGEDGIPPLNMEKYITETFPLSQAQEAVDCAALKSTMKVQLVMGKD